MATDNPVQASATCIEKLECASVGSKQLQALLWPS